MTFRDYWKAVTRDYKWHLLVSLGGLVYIGLWVAVAVVLTDAALEYFQLREAEEARFKEWCMENELRTEEDCYWEYRRLP